MVEKLGLLPVHQDSRLALLIVAIGVSLFLENGGQLVFGTDPKFFPEIIPSTSLKVGGVGNSVMEHFQPEQPTSSADP